MEKTRVTIRSGFAPIFTVELDMGPFRAKPRRRRLAIVLEALIVFTGLSWRDNCARDLSSDIEREDGGGERGPLGPEFYEAFEILHPVDNKAAIFVYWRQEQPDGQE